MSKKKKSHKLAKAPSADMHMGDWSNHPLTTATPLTMAAVRSAAGATMRAAGKAAAFGTGMVHGASPSGRLFFDDLLGYTNPRADEPAVETEFAVKMRQRRGHQIDTRTSDAARVVENHNTVLDRVRWAVRDLRMRRVYGVEKTRVEAKIEAYMHVISMLSE